MIISTNVCISKIYTFPPTTIHTTQRSVISAAKNFWEIYFSRKYSHQIRTFNTPLARLREITYTTSVSFRAINCNTIITHHTHARRNIFLHSCIPILHSIFLLCLGIWITRRNNHKKRLIHILVRKTMKILHIFLCPIYQEEKQYSREMRSASYISLKYLKIVLL